MVRSGSQRRIRWALWVLSAGLWAAAGCRSGGTDGTDGDNASKTDQEVIAAIRDVHPLVADLPPIPVPVELGGRSDDTAKEALQLLDTINSFRSNSPLACTPWDTASNNKSIRLMKAGGWQQHCDAYACYYTKVEGDLTITWTQIFGLPSIWEFFITWDGCDGEHEYDDFTIEHWHTTKDLKQMVITHYQYPDAPPCGDGEAAIGPGPLFRWTFELIEGGTLYTPGQVTYLDTRRYTLENWMYDGLHGYIPYHMTVCTSYPDGRLEFESWNKKAGSPLLYLSYVGIWTRDHRYCWTTYHEDGRVWSCGGDMGCPDCGP
jgi:hypothetical protein